MANVVSNADICEVMGWPDEAFKQKKARARVSDTLRSRVVITPAERRAWVYDLGEVIRFLTWRCPASFTAERREALERRAFEPVART